MVFFKFYLFSQFMIRTLVTTDLSGGLIWCFILTPKVKQIKSNSCYPNKNNYDMSTVAFLKGLRHGILSYFLPSTRLPLNSRKPENNTLQRLKNTKEIIINHKGTRMEKIDTDYKQQN